MPNAMSGLRVEIVGAGDAGDDVAARLPDGSEVRR
jgi:hypothetical protein